MNYQQIIVTLMEYYHNNLFLISYTVQAAYTICPFLAQPAKHYYNILISHICLWWLKFTNKIFISSFINASLTGPATKHLFHFIQILPSFHAMLVLTRSKTWETAAEDPAVSAGKRHRPPKCWRCVSPAAACRGLML